MHTKAVIETITGGNKINNYYNARVDDRNNVLLLPIPMLNGNTYYCKLFSFFFFLYHCVHSEVCLIIGKKTWVSVVYNFVIFQYFHSAAQAEFRTIII